MKLKQELRLCRVYVMLACFLTLAACSSVDRLQSNFEPIGLSQFRFHTFADATYPENSQKDEDIRIAWLEEYLLDNGICPNGYRITERKAVIKKKGFLGTIYDLYYYGQCLER